MASKRFSSNVFSNYRAFWVWVLAISLFLVLLFARSSRSDEIKVRYQEGVTHGFLALRSPEDKPIGTGELAESAEGDHMVSKFTLRFTDGSLYEETVAFSQSGTFRVLNYHLVQKGPSFKLPLDMTLDAAKGRVFVRYTDNHGKERTYDKAMQIPTDAANGLIPILAKNISPNEQTTTVTMIVATPKPRLVKLVIARNGMDSVPFGGKKLEAARYAVRIDLGGVTGALAQIAGKQPPDSFLWVLQGGVPTLIKARLPIFGGPLCVVELAAPTLPENAGVGGQAP